ncbi:hypothetical protein AAFF_G00422100 [Aldrovandia affinis]|uniref:Uncharacterized protein n=1 Tax=Aldrovandia affinis TaxID=143900 RepID=A0AAD7R3S6_9TELE|nr:hypothetical protein AAFF_G00422100 [Aldrovandia affinis]
MEEAWAGPAPGAVGREAPASSDRTGRVVSELERSVPETPTRATQGIGPCPPEVPSGVQGPGQMPRDSKAFRRSALPALDTVRLLSLRQPSGETSVTLPVAPKHGALCYYSAGLAWRCPEERSGLFHLSSFAVQ